MTNANDFAFNDSATRLRQATGEGIVASNPPLTKREYFAAMAMQGLIAHGWNIYEYPDAATNAVNAADALINALNENK